MYVFKNRVKKGQCKISDSVTFLALNEFSRTRLNPELIPNHFPLYDNPEACPEEELLPRYRNHVE